MEAAGMILPAGSFAVATNLIVSPSDAKLAVAGVTVMTALATVAWVWPLNVAVEEEITAVPLSTAVARPVASIRMRVVSVDRQKKTAGAGWPRASLATAVNRIVSPSEANRAASGVTFTDTMTCSTVTVK